MIKRGDGNTGGMSEPMYLIHKPGGIETYLTRMFLLSCDFSDDQPVEVVESGESRQTTIGELKLHVRQEETHARHSSPVGSR